MKCAFILSFFILIFCVKLCVLIKMVLKNKNTIRDTKRTMCPFGEHWKLRCVLPFTFCLFFFSFLFFIQLQHLTQSSVNNAFVHCSCTHKFHFSTTFSLKMGLATLFTHLKIILLQCFQFQFSVSVTISSIQTDPKR